MKLIYVILILHIIHFSSSEKEVKSIPGREESFETRSKRQAPEVDTRDRNKPQTAPEEPDAERQFDPYINQTETTTSGEVISTTIENKMEQEEMSTLLPSSSSQPSSSLSSASLLTTSATSKPTITSTQSAVTTSSPQTMPPGTESTTLESSAQALYPFQTGNKSSAQMVEEANCDFGRGEELFLCSWRNLNVSLEQWMASKGENYGWIGGPPVDHTSSNENDGYALYETARLVDNQFAQTLAFDSAMLMSPILQKTEAVGICVNFWYSMDGLSQDRLRVLLRPPPQHLSAPGANRNISEEKLLELFMNSDGRDDIVLWEHKDSTDGEWENGLVVYSFNDRHMIIFEGLPLSISDPNRAYRGYVALDDLVFQLAIDCKPYCNFEGGFCSWTQDTIDDFDWSLSRGSINPSTGPPMDRFSFNYGIKGGGYAYIDSDFPRRPQDKARLVSETFAPQDRDKPLCMRFWTHMFGNGIGALRVIIDPNTGDEETIWELRGEQGNNWYQGQVTITAISDFRIVFEAEVGDNNFGDIAIDEISIRENACPTSPQTASKFKGDCTFEVDECGWRNVEFQQRMDELDWERTVATENRAPSKDHTLKTSLGSFMSLPRTTVQRGERGWLMSPTIEPLIEPICFSFWYFMYDPFIEATGPSLGSLRVILMEQDQQGFQVLRPLWGLKNHQGPNWQYGQLSIETNRQFLILFEGLWGNSRGSEFIAIDDISFFTGDCSILPEKAELSLLDCDFTRDACSYLNISTGGIDRWYYASITRRPSTLADHSYGGPVGYLYFDVFNVNNNPPRVTLMSRIIERSVDSNPICLTFWFAPIGNDPDTKLTVNREVVDASTNDPEININPPETIWEVSARNVFKDRIEWMFGQVQVQTNTDYKISFVGEARKGGYALDDIHVYPGECRTRPEPVLQTEFQNK
ncbi:UNVERIFIED_CONTAM: hypothetical protein RMT77_005749 [Armadillidium vulgare]